MSEPERKFGAGEPRFYKYLSVAAAQAVLAKRTLRWSAPRTLNDPWDIQFDLHIDFDREAVKAAALQKLWDAHYGDGEPLVGNAIGAVIHAFRGRFPRLEKAEFDREFGEAIDLTFENVARTLPSHQAEIRALMANTKILCLTVDPASVPMWTHYADQHRGAVLRFRTIPELDSPWTQARPIQYVRDMPQLMDAEFMSDLLSGRASLDPKLLIDRVVFTKSESFAPEQEWRICSGDGRDVPARYEDIHFSALELDQIIFGARIEPAIREELVQIAKGLYPHAELRRGVVGVRHFGIEIQPL